MLVGGLWLLQAALFSAGLIGPWRDALPRETNGRVPLVVRMLLSLSLVLAAWLIWSGSRPETSSYTAYVFAGMVASFAGDLIMARLIPLPNRLIGGMLAFGAAHGLYVSAYVHAIREHGAIVANGGLWAGLLLYALSTAAGWWWYIRNPECGAVTNIGALLYGAWIGVMAAFALALAVALGGAWWLAAVGGVIFMVSDFIIGATDIGGRRLHNANDWIWLTYVGGQMGIIYAGWLA